METEDQLSLLPSEFKKHSALIAVECDISLQQRKAFNGFLALAAGQLQADPQLMRYEVTLEELTALTGIDGKNKKRLLNELEKLMSVRVIWNILGKDKDDSYVEGTVLLADFTLKSKSLIFGFSPLIRERILKPRMYAPLRFATIRALERKYSVILYELFKDYRNIKRFEVAIAELRRILGVQETEYNRPQLFESKVIAPAIEELNEKSELTIHYRYAKEGKSVTSIVFTIKEDFEKTALQGNTTTAKEQVLLVEMLPDFLRTDKKILTIIKQKYVEEGYDYVASNIAFAVKKAKSNPGRMVVMALEDDFAHDDREKAAKKKKTSKTPGEGKTEKAEVAPEVTQKDKYLKYFRGLPQGEQTEILDDIQRIREKGLSQAAVLMGTENDKIYGYLLNIRRIVL